MKLIEKPEFIAKSIQLFETLNVRFGVVLVGPTGGGKSTAYRVLASSSSELRKRGSENPLFQMVEMTIMNPKCITMGEFYGEFNSLTQEWVDGLASSIIRKAVTVENDDRLWTIFDGPIDALWIENMNTVLDDNMTLCLANSERIKLRNEMKMLFEVEDLESASPATVSRLGVVYVSEETLGWEPFYKSWLIKHNDYSPDVISIIKELFTTNVENILAFQRTNCKENIKTKNINLIESLCLLFDQILIDSGVDLSLYEPEKLALNLTCLFFFCVTWTIGITISDLDIDNFDNFIQQTAESISFGPRKIYDVYFDFKTSEFKQWSDIVPKFTFDPNAAYFSIIVPTPDIIKYEALLKYDFHLNRSSFISGITGTGKTIIVEHFLQSLNNSETDNVLPIRINFSAQTGSLSTQLSIEDKLEKKRKGVYGGPGGKKVLIFVDDINMPAVEEYGAQPPIELLRLFQDYKGFYDRKTLLWKDIIDTTLFVAGGIPGGGRNQITNRFTRHCHLMNVSASSDDVLDLIFTSIVSGFLSQFNKDIQSYSKSLVKATIEIFSVVKMSLKPTPAKFHYTFNLRDISKVIQGCLMIRPKECQDGIVFAKLWAHETSRVFCDRLINLDDKKWLTDLILKTLQKEFRISDININMLMGDQSILFVDWLKSRINGVGIYELSKDETKTIKILDDCLEDYNLTFPSQMNLVFFRMAVEHISRIARILRQPRGNAMLIGVGGSGKQSLTRIACFMAEMECVQIELTRGYSENEFHEDIIKLLLSAGIEGKSLVFLFTDNNIVHESFLEDINNLLNTGEIPNLLDNETKNKIIDDIRPIAHNLNLSETRDDCFKLFIQRVRDNLHIVLGVSPVGDSLRIRCRQFPSLINCCTIDWFNSWPHEALNSVANKLLRDLDIEDLKLIPKIAEECAKVHMSVQDFSVKFDAELRRKVYTTPKSFLDLINLYLTTYKERRDEIDSSKNRLEVGVDKLEATNLVVAQLKEELTKMQPVLEKKSEETNILLDKVSKDKVIAEDIKTHVASEADLVKIQKEAVEQLQSEAQAELDVALPALQSAVDALDKLDKKDITEVKSFSKPPPGVRVVMEAVCILLGEKPDWETSKKVLGNVNFMQMLVEYKKDQIPQPILNKLVQYIDNPDMAIEKIQKVSKAATSIAMWVHAMHTYAGVAKVVAPKKEKLEQMNLELKQANDVLEEKEEELQNVLDNLERLENELNNTMEERDRLLAEIQLTKDRLVRAEKLTSGLADERLRWKESIGQLNIQIKNLVGDVFLSCGCISYYGAFTGSYREEMISLWLKNIHENKIPTSEKFSLFSTLGDPIILREWNLNGLPKDTVSKDNAILVTRGKRWPLLIDPQEQAKKWIKQMESKQHIEVIKMDNINLLRSLENCIRIGKPLLIEDIGEFLDPSLEPVLQKSLFTQNSRLLIRLGDSDIDYDENFKFYMTTTIPNPHYLPEVCIKVTIINFTVTIEGLEDQLLGDVVKSERPDIEEKKNTLIISMSNDKKDLKSLEEKILSQISESKGNILDDNELIETLRNSKTVSSIIKERLQESEKTETEINIIRNQYISASIRGAIIYFVIADIGLVDPMYQYSLSYFIRLYNLCLRNAKKSNVLDERLDYLSKEMTEVIYTNICRGLFEKDKIIFSVLLAVRILIQKEVIHQSEWSLLLKGPGMLINPNENPLPKIITSNSWNLLCAAEIKLPQFKGISEIILNNSSNWETWSKQTDLFHKKLPNDLDSKIVLLHKILLIRAFMESEVLSALISFVDEHLGSHFVDNPPVSMAEVYKDSDNKTPVIFVLSTGADPTGMLLNFAKTMNFSSKLQIVALGQGQGPRAQEVINNASKSGNWVMLQNCHLAKSWMQQLSKIVENLGNEMESTKNQIHKDFRLFLTSMPISYFPVSVLQNGIKITNEPPKGIRANILRSMNNLNNWTDFEDCKNIVPWKKILFGLSFFHAVIQERRKFGSLGFNILYEFNDSDLETSIQTLKMFLNEQLDVNWDALSYVCGQINYGGRVTDDLDRRCLMCILNVYINPKILEDGFKFSKSGIYYSPSPCSINELITYCKSLPLNDSPEIFGMNENANTAFQIDEVKDLLETCLSVQPRDSNSENNKSLDEIVEELAVEIEEKIPPNLSTDDSNPKIFELKNGVMDSLTTVLLHEMSRYNSLLDVIRHSLKHLQLAIKGEELMDDILDSTYISLSNNRVPKLWENAAYPSLKPLSSWVLDLQLRIKQLKQWLLSGKPVSFWLSGFYFPQGFLTGVLQTYSRKNSIPIDTLNFGFRILQTKDLNEIKTGPVDGVYIYGLSFDCAKWSYEKQMLEDSPIGEMYSTAPIIHFYSVVNYKQPANTYSAPLYINLLTYLDIKQLLELVYYRRLVFLLIMLFLLIFQLINQVIIGY